jgi:hypothetical protein
MDEEKNKMDDEITNILIISICAPLSNKIKASFLFARKNKEFS